MISSNKFLFLLIFIAGLCAPAMPAAAAPPDKTGTDAQVEMARRQGVIGERIDGYLGVVDAKPDQPLLRKVSEINNKRRAVYDEMAKRTGVTTSQIARLAGEKQIEKAAPGAFVLGDDGRWRQKGNQAQ